MHFNIFYQSESSKIQRIFNTNKRNIALENVRYKSIA